MKNTNYKYILILFFLLFAGSRAFSQAGVWTQKASFGGSARQYAVGFAINGKGYVGTGYDTMGAGGYVRDFWEYDPATNAWTKKANFGGGARLLAVGFAIGNKGYIGTGQDFIGRVNDFWEYNPVTDVWTKKANFGGIPRARAVGMVIGGKGYIGTGYDDQTNTFFDDFWEYDPLSNTWTQKANFGGTARREAAGFSANNMGYIGTGYDGSPIYKNDFWQYNPATNTWKQITNYPKGEWIATGLTIGSIGYIIAGYGMASPLRDFYAYDDVANKWIRKEDFGGTGRFGGVGFSIGIRGYFGTGLDSKSTIQRDFWEYSPANIVTGIINLSRICVSKTNPIPIKVPYTISATFNLGNVFTAQLSDSSGSFLTPINIGTLTDTSKGTINAIIPANTLAGTKYRIRVISSNPAYIGSENKVDLSINPRPTASLTVTDTVQCFNNNSFNFASTSTLAIGKITQTIWNFGDGNGSNSATVKHSFLFDDTFTVNLKVISDSGCTDSINKIITVKTAPNASFTASDSILCFPGNQFTFTNTSTIKTGTQSFKWYPGNKDSASSTDLIYSYPQPGLYVVNLVATSNLGCTDTASKLIWVDSLAIMGFNINDSIQCSGNQFIFTNTSKGAQGFIWYFGDGTSLVAKNATHVYTKDSTYIVKLVTISSPQCTDSIKKKVYVTPGVVPDFSINSDTQNLSINYFVFTNLTLAKTGSFTSYWDFGDGDTSTQKDPTHVYTSAGTYSVKLVIKSNQGCKDSIFKTVWVIGGTSNADFTFTKTCIGDSVVFRNISSIQNDTFDYFTWDFGDSTGTIIRFEPKHMFLKTGNYTVTMTGRTKLGSKYFATHIVPVGQRPSLSITINPTTTLMKGDKATLTANGIFDSIVWSTKSTTSSIDVDTTGNYTVRVVATNGCDTNGSFYVKFVGDSGFTAPNTLTPNGDGINDLWRIVRIDKYQPCKLAIYNRWGDQLYSVSDYKNDWDGKYKGKTLPEGSYYFVLEAKDGKMYKGVVNIVW
jgi:gliding motility-associated-like protein